jgi:hypothetical protein
VFVETFEILHRVGLVIPLFYITTPPLPTPPVPPPQPPTGFAKPVHRAITNKGDRFLVISTTRKDSSLASLLVMQSNDNF